MPIFTTLTSLQLVGFFKNWKFFEHFAIPFAEPVIVFGIILLVILIIPFIFSKIKLPGIIGLILAGIALGNSGFNILSKEGSIEFMGQIGLLYLIFLTGLELDLHSFIQNKKKNIFFGLATFLIPYSIGFIVCNKILGLNALPSMLISGMFASQTLISYPIVSRLRLTKTETVGIAIAGTIITDTIVLVLLIFIIALHNGQSTYEIWPSLLASITFFLFFIFYIFPRIIKWFFKNTSTDLIAQYIFVLSMVFFAAILAKLVKLEPIIGAFLAGIVLNRQIPQSSTLMSRIEFTGNSIFIPIFILYLGMLLDLNHFINSWNAIGLAIVLITIAISTKWLAAYVTQKVFLYKKVDRQLLFGLTTSRAAATIAIILIGFQINIVNSDILNATIVVVFVSCLVSAFVTEKAAKRIVQNFSPLTHKSETKERFLIPIANPKNIHPLIEFSYYLKHSAKKNPIYLLNVVKDEVEIESKLAKNIESLSTTAEIQTEFIVRMDINISSGIVRAAKEIMASKIIMGWNGSYSTKQWIFGTILEGVLRDSKQPIYVVSFKNHLLSITEIEVIVPPIAEFETDFSGWLLALSNLAKQTSAKVIFHVSPEHRDSFESALLANGFKVRHTVDSSADWYSSFDNVSQNGVDSLTIVISARKGSISHSSRIDLIPRLVSKKLKDKNFVIIYPAQPESTTADTRAFLSGTGQVSIEEN